MSHLEFAGRIQAVVEFWREGLMRDSAMTRIAELSDELKLHGQLTASIEQRRCQEIGEEQS